MQLRASYSAAPWCSGYVSSQSEGFGFGPPAGDWVLGLHRFPPGTPDSSHIPKTSRLILDSKLSVGVKGRLCVRPVMNWWVWWSPPCPLLCLRASDIRGWRHYVSGLSKLSSSWTQGWNGYILVLKGERSRSLWPRVCPILVNFVSEMPG